jgi:hypothetical protein
MLHRELGRMESGRSRIRDIYECVCQYASVCTCVCVIVCARVQKNVHIRVCVNTCAFASGHSLFLFLFLFLFPSFYLSIVALVTRTRLQYLSEQMQSRCVRCLTLKAAAYSAACSLQAANRAAPGRGGGGRGRDCVEISWQYQRLSID